MTIIKKRQQLKIIDNFLECPLIWRSFALNQNFIKDESGYPGYKSLPLDEINNEIFHSFAGKLIQHVTVARNRFDRLKVQFAYSMADEVQGNIHQDEPFYNIAGLIYLNEISPLNTGTLFYSRNVNGELYQSLVVENVFNRMIIFDPQIWHAPANLFGTTIDDARLTITFFGIAS